MPILISIYILKSSLQTPSQYDTSCSPSLMTNQQQQHQHQQHTQLNNIHNNQQQISSMSVLTPQQQQQLQLQHHSVVNPGYHQNQSHLFNLQQQHTDILQMNEYS
jgi:hypothetical protein